MSKPSLIESVINGQTQVAVFRPQDGWLEAPPSKPLLLAGSFRPLHSGHRGLLQAGWEITGQTLTPCFEISIDNVEKPEIAASDLISRLKQFQGDDDIVIITRAATFLEKARLMPGTTFVVGYDTAVRLFDDRFYEDTGDGSPTRAAMTELRDLGSSFIVGGRHDDEGNFKTVRDMVIPSGFEGLLIEIPEHRFSDPISSTQLRSSQTSR